MAVFSSSFLKLPARFMRYSPFSCTKPRKRVVESKEAIIQMDRNYKMREKVEENKKEWIKYRIDSILYKFKQI